RDMRFVLHELVGLGDIARLPGCEDATPDLVDQVLEEAGKFASGVLAPLDESGDREGTRLENGVVRTAAGFAEAYGQFVAGGWNAVPFDPGHGGQGLPWLVSTAVSEMWSSANMSFALCPLLTQGAVELLAGHGSDEQKRLYLDKLTSGEWSGTMCMTEPQAGSDVGAIKTRAVRDGDAWRITGTKTFITYGEHDMTGNVVHLVLARTPEAPPGIRGVSLFVVPKLMVGADGALGARNDVRAVSLEHKLGINASPTCVMAFGDSDGALGYLIGEENHGIEYMFTMMNNARLAVGLQGVAVAERAYQRAHAYARERRQGRRLSDGGPARLVDHADVRRMLMTMKAQTEAMRALACRVAADIDVSRRHADAEARATARRRVDLLTPVVKAYCSDTGFEMASLGVQVHGGMGYIEETGAAQHLRDARIAMIYEGANGIQALDLVRRKLRLEDGRAMHEYLACLSALDARLDAAGDALASIRTRLGEAAKALDGATRWLGQTWPKDAEAAAAGATDYLRLFGLTACGEMMAEAALKASERVRANDADADFYRAKMATARFFAERILPLAPALLAPITAGAAALDGLGANSD
ncbi:MAG: acyl-CoA dehydrogenase, partial [Alphaproteobacteria bacterium]